MNYQSYSDEQLKESLLSIDREAYPDNYRLLLEELGNRGIKVASPESNDLSDRELTSVADKGAEVVEAEISYHQPDFVSFSVVVAIAFPIAYMASREYVGRDYSFIFYLVVVLFPAGMLLSSLFLGVMPGYTGFLTYKKHRPFFEGGQLVWSVLLLIGIILGF